MTKFTDAIRSGLQAYFQTDDIPTEAQFSEWIQAIQNGIEEHDHLATGGAASGTGDAAQLDGDALAITSEAQGDLLHRGAAAWARLAAGTAGYFLKSQGAAADLVWSALPANLAIATITFVIDGGASEIADGEAGHLEIPFACTITRVTTLADQSGSIVVDIWADTYANFPPTDADSITSATPPTISGAVKAQDDTLSGWTTAITAGDVLAFNVDSCTTIERVTISLRVTKSE